MGYRPPVHLHPSDLQDLSVLQKKSRLCWTYSMPGGSSSQLRLLQQHHVLHATFGQVIGHAGPHTSTTNDDSLCSVLPSLSQHCGCITERKRKLQMNCHIFNMQHAPSAVQSVYKVPQLENVAIPALC